MDQCTQVTYCGLHQTNVHWIPQEGIRMLISETSRRYQSTSFPLNHSKVPCTLDLLIDSSGPQLVLVVGPHPELISLAINVVALDHDNGREPSWFEIVDLPANQNDPTAVPFTFSTDYPLSNNDSFEIECKIYEQ